MFSSTLLKLFSIQREIYEKRPSFIISKEQLNFLLSEQFYPTTKCSSSEVQSAYLSTWRAVLDGLQRKDCLDERSLAGLFELVKAYIMLNESKYVVYEAQKLYVTLLKQFYFEESISFIAEVLKTESDCKKICIFLEICRDLLSKQNPNACSFLHRLERSISHVSHFYLTNICNKTDSYDNQGLFQLISVFLKIAKLAYIYENEYALSFVRELLTDHGKTLLDVLFIIERVAYFIKHKLIHFLSYVIMKLNSSTQSKCLRAIVLDLAECTMAKMDTLNMKEVFSMTGKTSFIGIEKFDKGQEGVDSIHLREWTFFCLAITALVCKEKQDGRNHAMRFLCRLDACIQTGLKIKTSVSFSWLPRVYGDQDDMWIDTLLLLMEIFPYGSTSPECDQGYPVIQHHRYFLQLVSTMCYDHLVLVDLLTSPETRFLVYLTRYLKYLSNTWQQFVNSVEQFGGIFQFVSKTANSFVAKTADNFNSDAGDSSITKAVDSLTEAGDSSVTKAVDSLTEARAEVGYSVITEAENSDFTNIVKKCSYRNNSLKETCNESNIRTKRASNLDTYTIDIVLPDKSVNEISDKQCKESCHSNKFESALAVPLLKTPVCSTGALAMIMDNYSDSEDDSDMDADTSECGGVGEGKTDKIIENDGKTDSDKGSIFVNNTNTVIEEMGKLIDKDGFKTSFDKESNIENHPVVNTEDMDKITENNDLKPDLDKRSTIEDYTDNYGGDKQMIVSHGHLNTITVGSVDLKNSHKCSDVGLDLCEKDKNLNVYDKNTSAEGIEQQRICEKNREFNNNCDAIRDINHCPTEKVKLECTVESSSRNNENKFNEKVSDVKELQEGHLDLYNACESKLESDDTDDSDTEIGSSSTEFTEDLMDIVMGMLIRTRLKLERLWESGIIQYNPEALLRLLEGVEENYENQ